MTGHQSDMTGKREQPYLHNIYCVLLQ